VWKYGADVNTDVIIPARYLFLSEADELAGHCMEDLDPLFVREVRRGDILMATTNFGCGSSREHAPMALKAAGISCVIAHSFARIFYRNALNIGLPILESSAAVEGTEANDIVSIDLTEGIITNVTKGKTFTAKAFPPFMLGLMKAGGLIPYLKEKLVTEQCPSPAEPS
jgi:3-isopropylmalate/(R)-2-methylmalate dehydratase small subunit